MLTLMHRCLSTARSPLMPRRTRAQFANGTSTLWPLGGVAQIGGRLEAMGIGGLDLLDFDCPPLQPRVSAVVQTHRDAPFCARRVALLRPLATDEHEGIKAGKVKGSARLAPGRNRKAVGEGRCAFWT